LRRSIAALTHDDQGRGGDGGIGHGHDLGRAGRK
jgi:hypothetical protein